MNTTPLFRRDDDEGTVSRGHQQAAEKGIARMRGGDLANLPGPAIGEGSRGNGGEGGSRKKDACGSRKRGEYRDDGARDVQVGTRQR
jgi:hypothetical protein